MLMAGVKVDERSELGLATVLVRKGKSAALAARVRERFGIELPLEPRRVVTDSGAQRRDAATPIAFAGTAPGAWLAIAEKGSADFAFSLAHTFTDLASVSDQSDGLTVLRVSGRNVRDMLCKVVPIDIHPCAFSVDHVAVTLAAHMPITMWRLPDEADGSAMFEIATFRSFGASFAHTVAESAAEFGLLR